MTDADEPHDDMPRVSARPNAETSFEAELDDEPPAQHAPVYVDVVTHEHELRPIIPARFRPENIKATAKRAAGRQAHRAGYHAVRIPLRYAPLGTWYALVGLLRLVGRLARWTFDMEARPLQHAAIRLEDFDKWSLVVGKRSARSARRLFLVGICAVPVAIAVALFAWLAPGWFQALVALCAIPGLARVGRPAGKPIVQAAVVAPQHRKLNSDIVLRAYYAAGIGNPDKPGQQIEFLSTMSDVKDQGAQVRLAVPFGMTFDDVFSRRKKIASGLDVSVNQVFLSKDKDSDRRHTLYIAYVDPLGVPAGPTPLLDCKPRDIWRAAPFGLDERGNRVEILLLWISILIGAQPRKGKTFSARLLALYAALDPYVRLFIADGKNSPDWRKFALVADMMIYGSHPSRDGDPVDQLLWTLRTIKKHIQKVNEVLSTLPASVCPEGKLTRALARDPRYPDLRVWMLVMEEFQIYYELDDKDASQEIASLLSYIMAVGPSAGVIILSSSQKPSGVGGGQDVPRLFTRYRDNHAVRFALKCGNRIVSEAVLGGDAYAEGYDASSLPNGPEYRGVGYLYGLTDDTPTVRTHLADHPDAEKILLAARRHREAAGTLSGMAAGEDVARHVRDILADVRSVFYAGEAWISWKQLAERMAEQLPEHYADLTQEAISAQIRALGVEPKKGKFEGASLWGVPRDRIEQAAKRREIEAGR
jgi:S-DNA-T family DNA segregation ATPase FtsK/SpoIIIE